MKRVRLALGGMFGQPKMRAERVSFLILSCVESRGEWSGELCVHACGCAVCARSPRESEWLCWSRLRCLLVCVCAFDVLKVD